MKRSCRCDQRQNGNPSPGQQVVPPLLDTQDADTQELLAWLQQEGSSAKAAKRRLQEAKPDPKGSKSVGGHRRDMEAAASSGGLVSRCAFFGEAFRSKDMQNSREEIVPSFFCR